jgi:hypothetical protein
VITSHRARKTYNTPTETRDDLDSWKDGYIDSKTADRIGKTGLRSTINQILKQDGTLAQRPSTVLYGVQPVGIVLGEITEFTRRVIGTTTVSQNYEISVQNVSGTAQVYYRKDGSSWTAATGKTFNTTARCHFCPIRDIDVNYNDEDKVLVLNGVDTLAYLDINTLAVVPFTPLPAASAPNLTVGTGITGTNYTHYYKVTAGNRGQTAASAEQSAQTQIPRTEWSGATHYIDVTITRVTNAKRYHVYYGGQSGQEFYLGSIDDPGSGTTVTFRDGGTITIDPTVAQPAPAGDTTAGPIGTRATFINGQVFIVGDKSNPKCVRYGGTGTSILDFSPYGGGGYEVVGGNKEIPVKVASFRENGGTPAITVLCKGTNGFGKRYIFTPKVLGSTAYFAVSEENGNDGTEAPDSVILAKDQLWYLSRDGVKTTLTKAQVQTILSTEGVSDNIENFIKRLNTVSLDYAWGLNWEGRLFWGVAVGSDRNNQIISLDLNNLRRGAWMLPWDVPADWGWLYNDNNGISHFCILQNNQILEFTDNVATQDNGVTFPTSASIGIQKFSKDGKEWGDMSRVTFVFNELDGTINCGINGKTEDSPLAILGSQTFISATPAAGWGEREWGALTWGDTETVPSEYGQARQEIVIEIGEELNWWEPVISTTTPNTRYELLEIIPEYVNIGIKD